MFGAIVRIAAAWAGSMVIISVLAEVLNPFLLPRLKDSLGADSLLYTSIAGVQTWLPIIITIAAVMALIARGITERRYAR